MHAKPSLPTTQPLWTPTSDANVLRPDVKRFAGYDAVRIILGLVPLTAAALKGYQLATEPVAETSLLTSRWFLIAVVEFELFFGLWLLAGMFPKPTWTAALLCFSGFACVSLYKAISGEATCGCFGRVPLNPWFTFLLDVAAVAAMLRWRPNGGASHAQRLFGRVSAGVAAIWLLAGIPAAVAMGTFQPTVLAENGIVLGEDNLVILEPEEWTGKRFPLLSFINDTPGQLKSGERPLRERLAEGDWIVVLYHHDCPKCQETILEYERLAHRSAADPTAPRVALVEVPPYGNTDSLKPLSDASCTLGWLNDDIEWFVRTPVVLRISNGGATAVFTE